jgi:nucleoside-diphosphate-sugar epimerase
MTIIPFEEISKRLTGERVMLIGGAGFIGHNLALKLGEMGIQTMIVDNLMVNSLIDNVYGERDEVQRRMYQNFLLDRFEMLRKARIELRNSDARILLDLTRAFDDFRPTKVVHLSAISSAVVARQNPGLCFDLQLVTLRNAIELARTSHAQVNQMMFLSSSTVYGDFEGDSVDESTRPQPKGIYANTKFMAERLLRTYNHQHGLGTTIIRPSALYGERCISGRVSQKFIENALTGKPLLLEGGGGGRLDFTYITDLVDGMIRALALHKGASHSNTYNLTFGNARTIAELADVVKTVVPDVILEERPKAEDKPVRGTLSTTRAEQELGFKAQWTLEEGYKQYCEWYVEQWTRAKRDMERN